MKNKVKPYCTSQGQFGKNRAKTITTKTATMPGTRVYLKNSFQAWRIIDSQTWQKETHANQLAPLQKKKHPCEEFRGNKHSICLCAGSSSLPFRLIPWHRILTPAKISVSFSWVLRFFLPETVQWAGTWMRKPPRSPVGAPPVSDGCPTII